MRSGLDAGKCALTGLGLVISRQIVRMMGGEQSPAAVTSPPASESRLVPLCHDVEDEPGDLVVDPGKVRVGELLVELGVALARLIEADRGREGHRRPCAGGG